MKSMLFDHDADMMIATGRCRDEVRHRIRASMRCTRHQHKTSAFNRKLIEFGNLNFEKNPEFKNVLSAIFSLHFGNLTFEKFRIR